VTSTYAHRSAPGSTSLEPPRNGWQPDCRCGVVGCARHPGDVRVTVSAQVKKSHGRRGVGFEPRFGAGAC